MRSHGNGHNSNALEGLEFANAAALAVLQNTRAATNFSGGVAAAAPVAFSLGTFFVTARGKVKVTVGMTAAGAGGTTAAGANVKFELLVDGVPLVGGPIAEVEMSPTKVEAATSLSWIVSGLSTTAGHTFGIRATDLTAGGTMTVPQYGASIVVQDLP